MDQAATLLATAGHALRIDFFPLRVRAVPVPAEAVFVVAHSLERAEKSGGARGHYNQRVAECALACAVLARALGRPLARLGDLPQPAATLVDLPRLLPEGPRSIAELVLLTGVRAGDLAQCRPDPATLANPERFVLRARVRHVLSEAARVAEAERTLAAGDLPAFGALMNASHQSCAGDYEVSTPALDDLAGVARRSGALGARLTGAGFGGAIVALVRPDGVERLLAGLDRDFYLPRGGSPSARFVVRASAGASLACF
jgi:galactokinase